MATTKAMQGPYYVTTLKPSERPSQELAFAVINGYSQEVAFTDSRQDAEWIAGALGERYARQRQCITCGGQGTVGDGGYVACPVCSREQPAGQAAALT